MKAYLVFGLFLGIFAAISAEKKVVCYWGSWASNLPAANINTNICTHVIYSFVGVATDGRITGVNSEPINENNLNAFAGLKSKNPTIKLMVAVGGANFGTAPFSTLASSATARSNFAKNSVAFVQKFKLDGLDLDWEYPVINSNGNDKVNFVLLLTELKRQLSANNLIFSIAVAAGQWASDQAYDIPKIQAQVDFINLMTYDLHGSWDGVTGHNAPMYNDPVSVDVCVKYWIAKGAPRDKLILGVATYGQLFTLANPNNNGFGAPTIGATTLAYKDICNNNWQRVWSQSQQVPYKYSGNQWVGYDDVESVTVKAKYSISENLGGIMIWSMENDDVTGSCGQGDSPLIKTVYDITIFGKNTPTTTKPVVTAPTTTKPVVTAPATTKPVVTAPATTKPVVTTATTRKPSVTVLTTTTKPSASKPFVCPTPDGLFPDPTNCSNYYSCGNGTAYSMSCGAGTKWNKLYQWCDYPENVQC